MGLFDGLIDGLIDLPGDVTKKLVETTVRLPEVPIKIAQGVVEGAESGVEKLGRLFD